MPKKVRKSKLSPRPYATGAGGPAQPGTTGWDQADAHAAYVREQGQIPRAANGQAQRDRLLQIVQLREQASKERDPARKSVLDAQVAELETLVALSDHAAKSASVPAHGNGGYLTDRQAADLQTAAGDLQALQDAMGTATAPFAGTDHPLPSLPFHLTDWGDLSEDEAARRIAALKARAEELLERRGDYALQASAAGEEATLAALRAFHNATGPVKLPILAAIQRQQNGGQARKGEDDRIARLSSRLDRLTDKLEKASEVTSRAEIDQERRDVAGQLLLARLRAAHRRLDI